MQVKVMFLLLNVNIYIYIYMLRNASVCQSVHLLARARERQERARVITVEVPGRRVAQRSVVALAVRSWMRLVLQFLQRTCPSRG